MKFTHMLCQYILWNKMMLDPLELELQMVISCYLGTGNQTQVLEKAVS